MSVVPQRYRPHAPTTRRAEILVAADGSVTLMLVSAIAQAAWCWPHDIDGDATTAYEEVHAALRDADVAFVPAGFVYDLDSPEWYGGEREPWAVRLGESVLDAVVEALVCRCDYEVDVLVEPPPVIGSSRPARR